MFFLLDHEFSHPAAIQDGDRTLDISFFQREPQEALPATPSAVTEAPPQAPGCSYRSPALPLDVPVTWGPIGASSGEHPVGRGTWVVALGLIWPEAKLDKAWLNPMFYINVFKYTLFICYPHQTSTHIIQYHPISTSAAKGCYCGPCIRSWATTNPI